MAIVTYLKGIRTRYRNFLEKEIEIANVMLRTNSESAGLEPLMVNVLKNCKRTLKKLKFKQKNCVVL